MKKFNLAKTLLTGALIALIGVGIQSCKKDDDPDRKKFIGSYAISSGTVTAPGGSESLDQGGTCSISENSAGDEKITMNATLKSPSLGTWPINNLTGNASGSTLTLDNQTINGFTYTGTGSINGNTLTMSISEYDAANGTWVYNFTATR